MRIWTVYSAVEAIRDLGIYPQKKKGSNTAMIPLCLEAELLALVNSCEQAVGMNSLGIGLAD